MAALVVALSGALPLAAPERAEASFQLGLQDTSFTGDPSSPSLGRAYSVLNNIAARTARITLPWWLVAPQGKTKPAGFNAGNPSDPGYGFWRNSADLWVKAAVRNHAQVILEISGAPIWAQQDGEPADMKRYGGNWVPNASELGLFARAAAIRYSGHFPDPAQPGTFLPHVRIWEIWNEENLPQSLGAPNLVDEYRAMLNAAYAGIKGVDRTDQVVVGGLAPVAFEPRSISPLKFAAQLMCVHRAGRRFFPNRACPQPAHFDIFAIHPYTLAATPTKHAYHYDDVLVGDVAKVAALMRSADRLHTVRPRGRHPIWTTEWGWFTNPPDTQVGDSWSTAGRYVAYSMYEMWRAGVSLVTWLTVQDPMITASNVPVFTLGGGLYDKYGRAKPSLRAFEFPFVASIRRGKASAWGRAPVTSWATIVVQRRSRRKWLRVASVRTGSDGVFTASFRAGRNGVYRARLGTGLASLAYDSRAIPPKRTHLVYSG